MNANNQKTKVMQAGNVGGTRRNLEQGMEQKRHTATFVSEAPLLRAELGEVLRSLRLAQQRTLREVSSAAQVSLGYLSEVERGQKEASSELLEAICGALHVPLWWVLREVSDRLALLDDVHVPDTVPDDLLPVAVVS